VFLYTRTQNSFIASVGRDELVVLCLLALHSTLSMACASATDLWRNAPFEGIAVCGLTTSELDYANPHLRR